MPKRIIQQRRGRGTGTYRAPSHNYKGEAKHSFVEGVGKVVDIIHCAGHSAPLIRVNYDSGEKGLTFAPETIKVGDSIVIGNQAEVKVGNVLALHQIPEGTIIHNIELRPGDGGKLVRTSGTFARVVAKSEKGVRVMLPSKKEKLFLPACRASIGVPAGAGRRDKPFLKAGTKYMKMRARNKLYPKVSGVAMNAVDHPFGGSSSDHKGKPTITGRNAPPGRKVGKIAPRRTGKKK